jgi:hypothetical protein
MLFGVHRPKEIPLGSRTIANHLCSGAEVSISHQNYVSHRARLLR